MNILLTIFFSIVIINNMVLAKFLGLCSFFGISKKLSNAFSMGIAMTLVMLLASIFTSIVYNFVLVPYKVEFMQIVIYILVIASLVQITELIIRRTNINRNNALGYNLPLMSVNCIVLAIALINATE